MIKAKLIRIASLLNGPNPNEIGSGHVHTGVIRSLPKVGSMLYFIDGFHTSIVRTVYKYDNQIEPYTIEFITRDSRYSLEYSDEKYIDPDSGDYMDGLDIISAERKRQFTEEGWTPEHDKENYRGEMAMAASAYAYPKKDIMVLMDNDGSTLFRVGRKRLFPFNFWDSKYWKPTPKDRIKELAKAGALIAAEIDRQIEIMKSRWK